jgi:hypothetical protein
MAHAPQSESPRPRVVRGGADDGGSWLRTVVIVGFAIVVLVVAGMGFVYKMSEFTMTIVNDDVAGFGVVAVATYLIGLVPIVFLTLWAVMTGKFRDIEHPKYRLFELDREIERGGDLRGSDD